MGEYANADTICVEYALAYWQIILTVPEIRLYVKWYSHKGLT